MPETAVKRWERRADLPLTLSTVAFLAAYAWPILDPDLQGQWVTACQVVVWIAWAMLAVDFAGRLWLSRDRIGFVKRNPIDLAVIALPLLRPLRLLRLVMLLNAFNRYAGNSLRGKVAIYLVGSVTLVVFVGALAILDAERGGEGSIQSFGDALWWAMSTVTSVGYGDTFPVTTSGRLIAVGLMLAGIAVLGVVTASFASWLVERVSEIVERVSEIEEAATAATHDDVESLRVDVRELHEELRRATRGELQLEPERDSRGDSDASPTP